MHQSGQRIKTHNTIERYKKTSGKLFQGSANRSTVHSLEPKAQSAPESNSRLLAIEKMTKKKGPEPVNYEAAQPLG